MANMKYAASRLSEVGMIGLIEPINRYSVPGYYMNDYEHAIRVIDTVNSTSLKLQFDLFHLQLIKGQITHSMRELKDYIGHVQIAQAPDRHEPDSFGEVDFKYVLNRLENEVGYEGYVGCEYSPLNGTVEGLGWINKWGYEF